jgi:aspartate carbamoyltransferase catalytic subunit
MVTSDHQQLLEHPVTTGDGVAGVERPRSLLEAVEADPTPLLDLAYRHVVSARLFDRPQVVQLCRLAADIETKPALLHLPLSGKIMISAFYEPSTRTRLSFESAWHRLGGDVISITDRSTTGIAKGESFSDVAEMFSNYGDVVVLRESSESAVYEMMRGLRIPIINAGNGVDEHPTQALSDIYALLKWNPSLADPTYRGGLRLGVIGLPARMRTVRSLLLLLAHFAHAFEEVVVVSPDNSVFSDGQREELQASGLRLSVTESLAATLPSLDIVYINSIAWVGESYERLTGDLKLSAASPLKPDAIVMHPLARGEELDTDLDDTPHNWYFAQARGAVFLRMALLASMTQRVSDIADLPRPDPATHS